MRMIILLMLMMGSSVPHAKGIPMETTRFDKRLVFATWVNQPRSLENVALLAASLREFGGRWSAETLRVYVDPAFADPAELSCPLGCVLRAAPAAPPAVQGLPFAGKAAAAALAEADAAAEGADGLAWLDDDTLILAEPEAFRLPEGVELGWRPVMHKNIAPLASEAPGPFWERLWEVLELPAAAQFTCVTVADGDSVRSYLNAGCLIVRPAAGLLGAWAADVQQVAADDSLRALCREDSRLRLFLHQAALGATVARQTTPATRLLLPDGYNWPLLFKEMFGARRDFHDLTGVVSLRHEGLLTQPGADGLERLSGPVGQLRWLREAAARAGARAAEPR